MFAPNYATNTENEPSHLGDLNMIEIPVEKIVGGCVFCSDPTKHLWKGIKTHLIAPDRRLAPLGLLGAPVALAYPEFLPIEYAVIVIRQIPFAMKKFPNLKEIIIVGHKCGYYANIPGHESATVTKMKDDLSIAAVRLRLLFPALDISAYYAKDDGNDGFDPVH